MASMDGGHHFETNPGFAIPVTLNGTTPVTVRSNLNVGAATHLWFYTGENPAAVNATNVFAIVKLKSPKFGAREATQ